MIKCLAIDDEPLALKQLENYISKIDGFAFVASCGSAAEARKVLETESVDVMFCDINMPDLDGMSFVKSLENPPIVAFTTAYPEYAVEGYRVDAVDYLLKPFGLDEFRSTAEKIRKRYKFLKNADVSTPDSNDSIFVKTEYKIVRVEMKKITYIEGMSEYLKIHTTDRTDPVIVLLSMKKITERLPSDRFMRIHKSFIINLGKISQLSKGNVMLESGENIPVGDLYRDALFNYIKGYFLTK